MTDTPFSFVRQGEIETANRVGVDEGGNKGEMKRNRRVVVHSEREREREDGLWKKKKGGHKERDRGWSRTTRGWKSVRRKRDEGEERERESECREAARATRERFNQTNAYK